MAISELLIDTNFDPPWFSSDYTFKIVFEVEGKVVITDWQL